MNGFRRRRARAEARSISATDDQRINELAELASNEDDHGAQLEPTVATLVEQLHSALKRIEALEAQVDELNEQLVHAPSHSDVLEVRMHGAKLAAELARTTVELRGEIGLANDEARRAMRASHSIEPMETTITDRETLGLIAVEEQDKPHPFSASA